MFIRQFQGLEREMSHERQSLAIETSIEQDFESHLNPQMKEILLQISTEPFLVNLLPHLIKFVESKSHALMDPDVTISGDVAIHNLILQVLKSIFSNKFFDLDFSLKTVIPVLMNLTLCSNFHEQSSLQGKLSLKEVNADLLGSLVERFH